MSGVVSFLLEKGAKNISATGIDNSEQQDVGSSWLDSSNNWTSSIKDASSEMACMESYQLGSGNYINSRAKFDAGSRNDINSTAKIDAGTRIDINSTTKIDDQITASGSVQLIIAGCVNSSSVANANEHKIYTNEESNSTNDHLINTSGLLKGITAYGFSPREDQENKDLVGLRIFYHALFNKYINLNMIA